MMKKRVSLSAKNIVEIMKSKMNKKRKGRRTLIMQRNRGLSKVHSGRTVLWSLEGIINWKISELQQFWVKLNCVRCGHGSGIIDLR